MSTTRRLTFATTLSAALLLATAAPALGIEGVEERETTRGIAYQISPSSSDRLLGSSTALGSSDPAPEMEEAGVPATPSLVHQRRCHGLFAPIKTTWDIEDWRPEVGWVEMISSRCNP